MTARFFCLDMEGSSDYLRQHLLIRVFIRTIRLKLEELETTNLFEWRQTVACSTPITKHS